MISGKEKQIYMNTLRYALRFLLRARTYTLINLLGLAFSLACCIILLRYIHRELTVDTHCVDREKVYAVQVGVSGGAYWALMQLIGMTVY